MSSLPSPFQSPITGMSLGKPQLRLLSETSQAKFPFESRLQMPLPGRKIPISSLPSPFQSPITGYVTGQAPAQARIRDFPGKIPIRVKAPDTTTRAEIPISSLPSPFQSPITGTSPGSPQLRLVSEPSQAKFPFESRLQIPLPGRKSRYHPFHHHSSPR